MWALNYPAITLRKNYQIEKKRCKEYCVDVYAAHFFFSRCSTFRNELRNLLPKTQHKSILTPKFVLNSVFAQD